MSVARWLRAARAWACYRLVLALPLSWTNAILPWAGDWAYAEDMRACGLDPWGDRSTWGAPQ